MSLPTTESQPLASQALGMRDAFAAHLVGPLMLLPKAPGAARLDMDGIAKLAFEFADAMVRAR